MKEKLPKISIVTPSFNQGKFLEETIRSVVSQQYPSLEYIIIDGGSTDHSVEVINRYETHLAYWVSEKDSGFANAINKGFSKSTGEILCWLNSDDLLLPGALLTVGKYFQEYRSVGLVFGNRHIINIQSALISKRDYFFYFPGQFRFGKTLPQECTFWRRGAFDKAGMLDESLHYAIDFDLWCRIAKTGVVRHIPFSLGAFRQQPQSKSSTLKETGIDERDAIILKYFKRKPSAFELTLFQFVLGLTRRLYMYLGISALKHAIVLRKLLK